MAIVGIVMVIIGIAALIYYPILKNKTARCSAKTQGKLIDIWVSMSDEYRANQTEHTFSYVVDGVEYQLKTGQYGPEAQKVGDMAPIWYNPRNPKEAQALHVEKGLGSILIFGIALILIGIVLIIL